jgi:hypothetical protein
MDPSSSYPGVLGQPSKWDELTFGFVGGVVAGSITTVEFLPFEGSTIPDNYTNVPGSLERARKFLDDNPENKMIGPFPDGDANIQQCMARPFFPMPPRYVNIFLGQRLPIREGFVKFLSDSWRPKTTWPAQNFLSGSSCPSPRRLEMAPTHQS